MGILGLFGGRNISADEIAAMDITTLERTQKNKELTTKWLAACALWSRSGDPRKYWDKFDALIASNPTGAAATLAAIATQQPQMFRLGAVQLMGRVPPGETYDTAIVQALASCLNDDKSDVRLFAAHCIGGFPRDDIRFGADHAVPALIQSLTDSDGAVAEAAAEVLGKIADPDSERALIDLLEPALKAHQKNYSETLWHKLVKALSNLGTPQALSTLVQAFLETPNSKERWEIAGNLKHEYHGDKVVDLVLPLLRHERSEIRGWAVNILGGSQRRDVIDALILAIDDEGEFKEIGDETVGRRTIYALRDCGSAALQPLTEAIPSISHQDIATQALEEIEQKLK